jgi:hypothetical protein
VLLQALRGINTRAPGTQLAAGDGVGGDGGTMPATPMTATAEGDVFDGIMTPAAAGGAAGLGMAAAAAAFGRPQGVPPLNTAGLAAASGQPQQWQSVGGDTPGAMLSGRSEAGGGLTRRESDAFNFLQTPAHGSGAAEAAAAALALAAAGGAVAAAAATPSRAQQEEEDEQGSAVSLEGKSSAAAAAAAAAIGRRPGFKLDMNDLAEDSGGLQRWLSVLARLSAAEDS